MQGSQTCLGLARWGCLLAALGLSAQSLCAKTPPPGRQPNFIIIFCAVAVALETIGDPTAAPTLAELLRKPGMTGHAITTLPEAQRKQGEEEKGQARTVLRINLAVRELVMARALYRCGDERGLANDILRRYEQDLQGPFARHAHSVLHGPRTRQEFLGVKGIDR